MHKVFGFVRRNPALSHDEYRAAHVGYHNSFGRRLNNIRGYLLNVRSNTPVEAALGEGLTAQLTRNEPLEFDARWDGWGQLLFDTMDDYLAARTPAIDRAGPNGLEQDPMVAKVGDDFDYLYGGSPFQFHVDEHVAMPVRRAEHKVFKLVQFVKRRSDVPEALFRAQWTGRYAELWKTLPGLRGLVMNRRTPVDVMTGFFAADAEGFTPEGTAIREAFYASWDGMTEFWLDDAQQFVSGCSDEALSGSLRAIEASLMSAVFYRIVDETVAVLPNRSPAPGFYYR